MPIRISLMMLIGMLSCQEIRCEILDRIAVTVAKQVITESDVIRDIRVSAFLDQKPVDLSGAEKRKTADRLVDQLLILQEIAFSRVRLDTDEDTANMLAQAKLQYETNGGYQAALSRYRIKEADIVDHLVAGSQALRFTDLRFRPEVEISDDDLHDAYDKLLENGPKKSDSPVPAFESSRDDLEKIVIAQRIAQALDRWLGSQRTQTQILYREQVFK